MNPDILCLDSIPTAYPEGEDGPAIKIISGKSFGVESPVRPLGGCWYFHITLPKMGQSVFQEIRRFPSSSRCLCFNSRHLIRHIIPIAAGWTAFIYSKEKLTDRFS